MKRIVYDIEGDDLLDNVSKIHCICLTVLGSNHVQKYGPDEIHRALDQLQSADMLIGHNILGYDIPALWKVCQFKVGPKTILRDTLLIGKLCFSDLQNNDFKSSRKDVVSLAGSHSLRAWGIRLNCFKGEYGEQEGAWKEFNQEMLDYCAQDVKLNEVLYDYLMAQKPSEESIDLEHRFAMISEKMSWRGFTFNREKAERLCERLDVRKEELTTKLCNVFPPHFQQMKKPQFYELTLPSGEKIKCSTKGAADQHRKSLKLKPKECTILPGPPDVKIHQFNPGSRKQIADRLFKKYGWESPEQTEKGNPIIDEDTLESCPHPEAKLLTEYLMIGKRLGQVRDGANGWLKLVRSDGRIHHRMDTIGCATQRASHANPNLGQVPSIDKEYGPECRELFEACEGYKLVGCDLSGIEARMMAHFLWKYDRGNFADIVLNGDIHQINADNLECDRQIAKCIFYGWMYGAGDFKLMLMHPYKMAGKEIRRRFERGITGLGDLMRDVKKQASRGYLQPLDGRKLPIRSEHAAFNTLLQGSAAIVMKRWVTLCFEEVKRRRLNAYLLACVHDETQTEVIPDHVEEYIDVSLGSIKLAQQHYKLHIPLDGEAKVGSNWKECH